MITIVILDEVLLWMRCLQLRWEAREAMNRLIEVLVFVPPLRWILTISAISREKDTVA